MAAILYRVDELNDDLYKHVRERYDIRYRPFNNDINPITSLWDETRWDEINKRIKL